MAMMYGNVLKLLPTAEYPPEVGMVDRDPDFWKRPSRGKLFMRSYTGQLIHQPLQSLQELGEFIATTDDLYACAAGRYYEYFTGNPVNLRDLGDPITPPLSEDEKIIRETVLRLAASLKRSQSLTDLVRNILNDPIYRTRSMRSSAAVGAL